MSFDTHPMDNTPEDSQEFDQEEDDPYRLDFFKLNPGTKLLILKDLVDLQLSLCSSVHNLIDLLYESRDLKKNPLVRNIFDLFHFRLPRNTVQIRQEERFITFRKLVGFIQRVQLLNGNV
jgi:hypothetical protein